MQQKLLDDRYGVSGLLGSGGMAKVYLAHDEVLGREVALKVLREQYAENEEFVERFRREAQAAASLSHPNIVAIYDRGRSDGGSYYIVMEYVSGGTLKDRIVRDGAVGPDRAAELAAQVAGALGAAHARGVVHRDVKPQNVLLTASGDAKVTDFGIARAASEASLSGASMILGTVSYMSPEQALGKPAGPRSDLYSLGVVLHEMLTGRVPFEAETPMAVSMKHVNEPAPPLRETDPDVPEGLNAIRSKLLAKNPEDRYATSAEVVEDLRRVRRGQEPLLPGPALAAQDAPTSILAKPVIPVRRRGRRKPLALRTAAAFVGIFGLVGVFGLGLTDSQGRQPDRVVEEVRQAVTGENEVSRVVGVDRAEAQRRLIGAGFEVDVLLRESSKDDAGKVIAQSVPGGKEVEKGTKVVLEVGEGPAPVPAPDLAGLDLAAAEDVLGEAGLKVGETREEKSETVPEGLVIEQDPPVGEPIEPGTPVDLVLSLGPGEAPAPADPPPNPEPPPADPLPDPPPADPLPDPPPAEPEASAEPAATPEPEAPAEPVAIAESEAPDEPVASAEPDAPPVEPAPEPVAEPEPEPSPEQYEPEPRQYEPADPAEAPAGDAQPAVGAQPAPETPPAEQYDAPPRQSPQDYVDSVMEDAGMPQPFSQSPEDRSDGENPGEAED